MTLSKLKGAASALTLAVLAGTGGLLTVDALAAQPAPRVEPASAPVHPPVKPPDPPVAEPAPRPAPNPEEQSQRIEQLELRLRKMEDDMKELRAKLDRALKSLDELEQRGKSKW